MEEERGDPRWPAALEVLDRVNTSASPTTVVREGLSLLLMSGSEVVRVVDAEGAEIGVLTLTTIRMRAATSQA